MAAPGLRGWPLLAATLALAATWLPLATAGAAVLAAGPPPPLTTAQQIGIYLDQPSVPGGEVSDARVSAVVDSIAIDDPAAACALYSAHAPIDSNGDYILAVRNHAFVQSSCMRMHTAVSWCSIRTRFDVRWGLLPGSVTYKLSESAVRTATSCQLQPYILRLHVRPSSCADVC